jgi:hypothetical protein
MRRLILISATILLAAGTGVPLAAQTLPTNDPALRRIWTVAMDSSQTEPLAQQLLDSVGPRLTGTPGAKRGNDWLVKTYADWGISAQNEPGPGAAGAEDTRTSISWRHASVRSRARCWRTAPAPEDRI